ncbi:leucine-rich repeat extensin-like protein 3 [Punica granatum]|uniref:Leucine-rich repeat extensin-like protein 3 n=1 Tax=Punica granatum TaxID=22663 RepID=A0A6P8BTJ3_PUNGR|nr:leucine-rich repeat extensin-like protein 3 [Punica granatum]
MLFVSQHLHFPLLAVPLQTQGRIITMTGSRIRVRGSRLIVFLVLGPIHFAICDARITLNMLTTISSVLHTQNTEPYGIRTPDVSLPPFESISPLPMPAQTIPPVYAFPPGPPSFAAPAPVVHPTPNLLPPASPSPPKLTQSPSPPEFGASPPKQTPSPPKHALSPPIQLPPMVFPPPSPPPQQHKSPVYAVWCVAKPTVPDPIMQGAMDYACGAGADCKPIQPNGPCFQPNTLLAHASFAFNSYFQNKKARGGTCEFGGAAMLVTVDPSFNECHFTFN